MIIDTDIFTNADDVGALASALAMQHDGEAKVIAIAVNTPTYRTVAADQWKCVAAIDNFYGSASIPIGIQGAVTGADTGSPYLGSCGPLAPASAPVPDTAVKVYRQALASQANGSVAVVSIGYMGNLAALLKSRADAISSLTGTQLVQQKVSALVVMGGGYLSGNGENNLAGDQASAQYVTDNWPAKIVWSGYEVGQNVLTGQTIASAQPSNSPVRIAYQAYAGAGHAIQSWDLTAVYYAGRPTSPFLTATGPGTNTINTTSGSNVFTMGTGNQYYLKLSNTAGFQCSIESLLDTLPASPALGQISGTVVDASAGNRPLTGALVRAYDAGGNTVASAQTGANGTYTLSGLTAGCYRLGFSATGDRVPQYYNNTSMLAGAASLSLPAGAVVTGINAALGTVAPTPTPTPTPQSGSQQGQVPAVPPGSAPAVHPPAVTGQRGVTPAVSSATLRGQLIKLLTPRGKGGTIKTLLTLDGWTASFAAPTPGRLLVSWYHAQNHGRKVTVAVATVTFQQAGLTRIKVELTRQGRTLLRGAKRLTLSARASFKPLGQSATSASRQLTVGR
ncbi:MAG TPA: nucleoside hydrolase [Solirubrobacteraceae bacterium]|nr:nucleoside hydrolase [Solirubrobacteraceae bacterium]